MKIEEYRVACVILLLVAIFVRVMFFQAYRSTDFEVHRNWKAITFNLPLSKWYFENTSEWTLDYPPFFAYFECVLAWIAKIFRINILQIVPVYEPTWREVYFMRSTVIATETVFIGAILNYCNLLEYSYEERIRMLMLSFFNASIIILDHVHFQYNGYLLGLLLACINASICGWYPLIVFWFSLLMLSKHLYAPLVFPFGVYVLAHYCSPRIQTFGSWFMAFSRFLHIAFVAMSMISLAFFPFVLDEQQRSGGTLLSAAATQATAMLSRLFPFSRGLVHAYWAPNVWALYCAVDRGLIFLYQRFPAMVSRCLPWLGLTAPTQPFATAGFTGGLVGEFRFSLLPQITAAHCLLLTLLCVVPATALLYRSPTRDRLIKTLLFVSFSTFMLGYHVHEKAILTPMVLASLICLRDDRGALLFYRLSIVGTYTLLPLLQPSPQLCLPSGTRKTAALTQAQLLILS